MTTAKSIKQVEFRIFSDDYKQSKTLRFRLKRGRAFTSEGVELLKQDCLASLNDGKPESRYHLVQVGRNRFNVIHTVGNA